MNPLLKTTILLTCLFIISPILAADCQRSKYYGNPINFIHKSHEYLNDILQYSNVNTTVRMVGYNRTSDISQTTIFEDIAYEISYNLHNPNQVVPQIERRALLMRVITPQGMAPRLGNYVLTDPGMASFPYYLTIMFNLELLLDFIWGDPELYLSCSMLKEEYTYFPSLFPSRFSKILQ